jgi:hypothetical protein
LVEHLICNQGVAGSIPAAGTILSLRVCYKFDGFRSPRALALSVTDTTGTLPASKRLHRLQGVEPKSFTGAFSDVGEARISFTADKSHAGMQWIRSVRNGGASSCGRTMTQKSASDHADEAVPGVIAAAVPPSVQQLSR